MNIILLSALLILALCFIFGFYRSYKYKRRKNWSIYKWMKIGKNKRSNIDNKEKLKTLHRKTRLINKTRSEYLKLRKK